MYVKNVGEKKDKEKFFYCIKVLGNWLIYKAHLPLFGRTKDDMYIFARTEKLQEALDEAPFYLKAINDLKGGG